MRSIPACFAAFPRLVVFILIGATYPAQAGNRLILEFTDSVDGPAFARALGLCVLDEARDGHLVLIEDPGEDALLRLESCAGPGSPLIGIEADLRVQAQGTRSQSFIDKLPMARSFWDQPAASLIQARNGDPLPPAATGTTVAVLDTGVDPDHPLLKASLVGGGYDFIDDDDTPTDVTTGIDTDGDGLADEALGHGSHASGLVLLVDPAAALLPFRVLDSDGQGSLFDLIQAIDAAVEGGAGVITMSLGMEEPSDLLEECVNSARAAGCVLVAAAGNTGDDTVLYPAAFSSVLAATASDLDDVVLGSSSYGYAIDLLAPGAELLSAHPGGGWLTRSGSSMAAALVAGAAAFIREQVAGDATRTEQALLEGAIDVTEENPDKAGLIGEGRLDVLAAEQSL
ncbi:MAG: S8 family serine peptidase [Planctomycetota bacterium]